MYLQGVNEGVYDFWATYNAVEEQEAYREMKLDAEMNWIRSMIRMDNPHMDEDDVELLAQDRYETGFYEDFDF